MWIPDPCLLLFVVVDVVSGVYLEVIQIAPVIDDLVS
jgi:hypothetical protein